MSNILEMGLECVGCRSCEQSCFKNCISIQPNKEGFLYPVVDTEACVDCGLCLKHCPVYNFKEQGRHPLNIYGLKNKNCNRILNSASGGASDLFAQFIIKSGGVVFGCAYTDNLQVKHIEVDCETELYRLQSSKYVQSDIGDCYALAKKRLDEGKVVLFTGTPCQIGGLYIYLRNKKYKNLFTVDIICHGVPSEKLLRKYFNYQEKKLKEKIEYFNFRSKEKRGWGTQYLLKTKTKTKTKTKILSLDKYGKHFMDGDCYRESCYRCKYASIDRVSDVTVGDFWGVEKSNPKFSSSLGVSLVLVNTEKGKQLIDSISDEAEVITSNLRAALSMQNNLKNPTARPSGRDSFYINIDNKDFFEKMGVGLCLKERIKAIIPQKIIFWMKRIIR